MTRSRNQRQSTGQLRIIGGQWRGRKLRFVAEDALRPTPDRVRETLFNWLAPYIHGARCADLFAGSGALGLEALSRGAAFCDFVDTSRTAIGQLTAHLDTLGASGSSRCHVGNCGQVLNALSAPYDIVFLDPPFSSELAAATAQALNRQQLLGRAAFVYVESAATHSAPTMPTEWHLHREKVAGEVAYRLYACPDP